MIVHKEFIMKPFRNWLVNLFDSMAIAFIHPIDNELPPEIGTHSYSHKPYKKRRGLRYN